MLLQTFSHDSVNTSGEMDCQTKFDNPLTDSTAITNRLAKPRPYQPGLTPAISPLHLHCLARDRLQNWCPFTSQADLNHSLVLSDSEFDHILTVITYSWAASTRETYGAGLLVYHVYCDMQDIPEPLRCPASPLLIMAFISSCAGSYLGNALANYVAGLRAWHILHRQAWPLGEDQVKATPAGAVRLASKSSK